MFLKRSFILATVLLAAETAQAQTTNLAIGGVSSSWLNLAGSARAEGMGEATVAVADDVNALGVNPAGLGRLEQAQISLTHHSWVQGVDIEEAVGSFALGNGNLALGFTYGNFGDVERYTVLAGTPVSGGVFQPSVLKGDVGFGFMVDKDWSLGLSAKVFQDNLDGDQATGFAGDAGALWNPNGSGWTLGLAVLNMGAQAGGALPTEGRLGVSYQFLIPGGEKNSKTIQGKFLFSMEGMSQFQDFSASSLSLGGEYWYKETVAIRLGQQLMDTTGLTGWSGFSAGAGLRVGQIQVDYAFATRGDLGNSNMVSLLTRF